MSKGGGKGNISGFPRARCTAEEGGRGTPLLPTGSRHWGSPSSIPQQQFWVLRNSLNPEALHIRPEHHREVLRIKLGSGPSGREVKDSLHVLHVLLHILSIRGKRSKPHELACIPSKTYSDFLTAYQNGRVRGKRLVQQ